MIEISCHLQLIKTFYSINDRRAMINEKESPDVETPGLLVKALISSYFKKSCFLSSCQQI
jgi:hypothetical protein